MNLSKEKIVTAFSKLGLCFLILIGLAACAPTVHQSEHTHLSQAAKAVEPTRITIDQVRERLAQGQDLVFLDARNDVDWGLAESKIPGSIRVGNNQQLATLVKELSRERFIVPYCT